MSDLQSIIDNITRQKDALSERTGAITRSIAEKQEQLSEQLISVRAKIIEYQESATTNAVAAQGATVGGFSAMQTSICLGIDNVISGSQNAVNAMDAALNPFYDFNLDNVNFDLRGGKKRRARKSKKAKKSKKSKKSRKAKKTKKAKKAKKTKKAKKIKKAKK